MALPQYHRCDPFRNYSFMLECVARWSDESFPKLNLTGQRINKEMFSVFANHFKIHSLSNKRLQQYLAVFD